MKKFLEDFQQGILKVSLGKKSWWKLKKTLRIFPEEANGGIPEADFGEI